MALFKQKCIACKKNYVIVSRRDIYPICYECHKKDMGGEITDKKMAKMFDIPEDLYKTSMFLRNIKITYLRYQKLSEKQIAAFEKTVKKMKEEKKN